jgi:hypothetical protein
MNVQLAESDSRGWLNRNRWPIGFAVAALVGGLWWRRSHRRPPINVGAVSERWLAEQEFEAGQKPAE